MGFHLGLHVPAMIAGLKWNGKIKTVVAAVFAVASGAGFWLFVKNGIPDYVFFRTPFAFFDYDKAAALVFLENLAILTAFAFLGAETASFIKSAHGESERQKKDWFISAVLVALSLLIGAALLLCTGGQNGTSAPSWGDPTQQTQTDVSAAPDDTPATSTDVKYDTDPANVGDVTVWLDTNGIKRK